jgi:hypothetical protein
VAESSEQLVWALDLDVKSDSATDGAAALEKLRDAIQGGTTELREMQAAMRNLKGSSLASDETIKGLKDRIAASKATLAGNTLEMVKSKGAFDKQPKPVDKLAEAIKKLDANNKRSADILKLQMAPALERNKKNVEAFGPKLGGLVNQLGDFKGLLSGGMIAAGLGAMAGAMVAVTGAVVAATFALLGYAIAQADARRSDLLRLEGLSKVRNYWLEMVTGQRRAADSSTFLQKTIDGVAAGSALSRERIGEMTSELYRAGLRGQRLKDGLEGLAIVEATQGKESGAAFKARALGAQIYGTSIKALTNDVKTRLGPTAKAMMLGLDVQSRKAHENIAHLFDGLKIENFLEVLSKITEMFSQNTATGRALKAMVESLLQPLIDTISTSGPIVKKFFQGMVIGALLVTIAILKVRNYLRDTFGGSDFLKNMNLTTTAVNLGALAFGMLAGVVIISVAAVGALVGAVALLAAPLIWAIKKVTDFATSVQDAFDVLAAVDWADTGRQIVDGIASGITGGASSVISAITTLGADTMAAFKKKLGIASPSKVAFKAAIEVPHGIVKAHEAGRSMVKASAAQLGAAAEDGMRAGASGASSAPVSRKGEIAVATANAEASGGAARGTPPVRPSVTVNVENLNIGASQSPEQIKESLREAVETIFERTAHTMGAF